MTARQDVESRVTSASGEMSAGAHRIFELIADPSQQPGWDANDNLSEAPKGQRVRFVGDAIHHDPHPGAGRREPCRRDEGRVSRVRATTADELRASLDRLGAMAETR
jgi:hypothetical protein